ncbi:putative transcriptional regulators [Candidatus Termititenax persephonae]|uniref:Transcriptional regulators n=1 Tax=Candidatus Termititenax persephonae TaxID=2218525 RepID=A0A388TEY0_9BACT|nr:putative transcriptional regulators [Candidatus Termititenax persephonae]
MEKSEIEKRLKTLMCGKLKQIKEKNGYSLEEMAYEIGLDYASFYSIYKGRTLPRMVTLFQISETYGIPLEAWFRDVEKLAVRERAVRRREFSELARVFNRLDIKAQKATLKILRHYLRKQKGCEVVSVFFSALPGAA